MLTQYGLNLHEILRCKKAVSAVEYGLIAALIAVVSIVALKALGTNLSTTFTRISTSL